jgi:tetratricopeptide (TPR) repeat protein
VQAERLFRDILTVDNQHREALENLVVLCLQTGKPDEAEQHLRFLIYVFPTQAIYCERLVTLLNHRGKSDEAIASYRELLQRNPGLNDSRYNLARLLKRYGRTEEALQEYKECLRRGIEHPEEVHTNISVIYSDQQLHDAARQSLQTALAVNPKHVPALYNLGQLEEEGGDWVIARELFNKILKLDPAHAGALAHIANGQKVSDPVDPLIRSMKRALRRDQADPLEREELLYALGKAHDDCGQYAKAMDYYQQANSLSSQRSTAYDPRAQEKLVDDLIEACDNHWLNAIEPASLDAHIFVCGMFRSGSTLVEQILAAHPAVTAGGEIDYFQRQASPFPAVVLAMGPAQLSALGKGYNTLLMQAFPGAQRITNKRPDNFLYLGLIKALFPKALIVHTRRQPLDNCLSLFFQALDSSLGYANRLQHAGHYYLQYCRVMDHWQQLIGDSMLTVDYDTLVAEPQQTIGSVLDFLELEWHDDCLQFHQLRNRVRTASLHQVRQPMYRSSSGRWQHYTRALEPLQKDLQQAGMDV